jgi:hypothetical protein
VCLALAFTPLMADRADRTADRSRTGVRGAADDASTSYSDVLVTHPLQAREHPNTTTNRAESLIAIASDLEGDAAISALMQAVQMGTASEKSLAEAYARLGDLYAGAPSKQVNLYGLAMQYTSEPSERARLQSKITELGGNVFDMAMTNNAQTVATRDAGPDDFCDGAVAITLPWSEVMSITPANDENWRSIDLALPEGEGVFLKIETISQNPPYYDDTTLAMWAGCDAGTPEGQLYLNDDGGEGFMSLIETACLGAGTYYIDVYGYFFATEVFDFTLDVQQTGTCVLPSPDAYEPDDERDQANPIGFPTSIPAHANGWGRAKTEIQDHSIFPAGDWDNVNIALTQNSFVTMGTAIQFPTFFNDFESIPGGTDIDSYVELLYGNEPGYGGFCNDPDNGFNPWCQTDDDCPEPVGPPIADYPTCIPIAGIFTIGGIPFYAENPLASNEDISGSDWASELDLCLPRTAANGPLPTVDADFIFRAMSSPVYDPAGTFLYQMQVKNQYACNFETEDNGDFPLANPINLGETWHGFTEFSENIGGPCGNTATPWFCNDNDLYRFDVEGEKFVEFETTGYDLYLVDTGIELYVGPDDSGLYYFTGVSNDDYIGWWSYFGVNLGPASDLLGNMYADADYFLNVTTFYPNVNFPYTLFTSASAPPNMEVEPNDDCASGNAVASGDTVLASLDVCDYDSFTFSLSSDTYVVMETGGDGGDTTMMLTSGGTYLGCDDDGADTSLYSRIEGCLPAGDYCAQVRPYSSTSGISAYEFSFSTTGSCSATTPPSVIYDELYRCDGSGYASSMDEFLTCPN